MKPIQLILFLFTFHSFLGFAQEKVVAKIHYKFSHLNDTNYRDNLLNDEVVTYLGKQSSYYTSYTDIIIKEDIDAQKLVADFTGHLVINFSTTPIKEFYLINSQEDKLYKVEAISSSFDAFVYEIPMEQQDWLIHEEIKNIGGYICQRATTNFKGRNYEAWFTTELPFPFGPWKLHGLPGLILSAHDSKLEVQFEYAGFDRIEAVDIRVEIPPHVVKSNREEVDKLRKVFLTEQSKYYEILRSSGRSDVGTHFLGIDYTKHRIDMKTDDDYRPSHQTNNPIELK